MQVSEIMTKTIHSVRPQTSLKEAAKQICLYDISGMTVVDEAGKVVGVISERDILLAIYPKYTELIDDPLRSRNFEEMESRYSVLSQSKVEDVMSKQVFAIEPTMPILQAASMMLRKNIRRLPVVDNGKLVGIISLGDVHQALFAYHLG